MNPFHLLLIIYVFSINAFASIECSQENWTHIKVDSTQQLSRFHFDLLNNDGKILNKGIHYNFTNYIRDFFSYDIWYDADKNILLKEESSQSKSGNFKYRKKSSKLTDAEIETYQCLLNKLWEHRGKIKNLEAEDRKLKERCAERALQGKIKISVLQAKEEILKNCKATFEHNPSDCDKVVGMESPEIADPFDECILEGFPILYRGSHHDSQHLILADGDTFKLFQYDECDDQEVRDLRVFLESKFN